MNEIPETAGYAPVCRCTVHSASREIIPQELHGHIDLVPVFGFNNLHAFLM